MSPGTVNNSLEALGGTLYHYRDKNGLECDTIAHLDDGRYALIEIKLGGDAAIETGAATLKRLARLIDTNKMRPPLSCQSSPESEISLTSAQTGFTCYR